MTILKTDHSNTMWLISPLQTYLYLRYFFIVHSSRIDDNCSQLLRSVSIREMDWKGKFSNCSYIQTSCAYVELNLYRTCSKLRWEIQIEWRVLCLTTVNEQFKLLWLLLHFLISEFAEFQFLYGIGPSTYQLILFAMN